MGQSVELLIRQSLIRENLAPDSDGNGVYTILEEYISHWPIKYLLQCTENIRKGDSSESLKDVTNALEKIATKGNKISN